MLKIINEVKTMKFAIVSDSHDHVNNFTKVINWLNQEKIKLILHCGDICNQETINEAIRNFKGEIKFVRGNADQSTQVLSARPSTLKKCSGFNLEEIPEKQEVIIGGKSIFFNHYPDIAKKAAESGKYDIVFYGHTHRPWEEKISSPSTGSGRVCRLVNPGELAGQRYKPTFALYDPKTDKLSLKILELL